MGDVIAGRFELLDPIARGGTGSVWRAWDHKHHQVCAAKVLRQRDSAELLRFVREQSVAPDHPHLLTPYGWAAEDAHVVIAMPLAAGGTVAEALSDFGAFGSALTATVLDQVLAGLAALHQAGWVHRDVKPANLLFEGPTRGDPHVRVADFGIALHRDDARLTHTGLVPGTSGFLAPEVLDGSAVEPAQDVYAAGVCAIRMLGGAASTAGRATPPPDLAPDFAALLSSMVTVDAGKRPTAQAARARLRAVPGLLSGALVTADDEPFEVFDHLTHLTTWPSDRDGVRRPREDAGAGSAATHAPEGPPAGRAVALGSIPPNESTPLREPHPTRGSLAADRPPTMRERAERARRRRRGVVAALMSLVALVAGLALILSSVLPLRQAPPDPGPTPSPGAPVEDPGGQDGSARESPTDDDSGDPSSDEPVQAGQRCSWEEENTSRTGHDGDTLTCTRQGGSTYT